MPRGRPRKMTDDVLMRSAEFIGWALGGLEREIAQTRERLTSLTDQAAKLRARVGRRVREAAGPTATDSFGTPDVTRTRVVAGRARRRRRMSAEARKRISDMMKKRWAERRKKSS